MVLQNDLSKRNQIITYIKQNNHIAVFAYGSLLWNPIEDFNEIVCDCFSR